MDATIAQHFYNLTVALNRMAFLVETKDKAKIEFQNKILNNLLLRLITKIDIEFHGDGE